MKHTLCLLLASFAASWTLTPYLAADTKKEGGDPAPVIECGTSQQITVDWFFTGQGPTKKEAQVDAVVGMFEFNENSGLWWVCPPCSGAGCEPNSEFGHAGGQLQTTYEDLSDEKGEWYYAEVTYKGDVTARCSTCD